MGNVLRRMMGMLFTKKLEVVLVGLENSGKTTLLQVLSDGSPVETAPTIGLNVRMVKRGGVQMKCWDLGGQSQYRSEWEAKSELHRLLEDRELATTPLLIVANKIDLEPHATEAVLIKEMNLDYIVDNPWMIIPCSALKTINIDEVVQWLIRQADNPRK